MWDLLKKNDEECSGLRDLLEESATARPDAGCVEELGEAWPSAQRAHVAACHRCQEAVEDLVATREIFKGVASQAVQGRPWFATQVIGAIRAQERKLALGAALWNAVPRYASRLAWISVVVLLAGSTWLYERPAAAPNKAATAAPSQEYLFEVPAQPINQDDVLISMAEKNP